MKEKEEELVMMNETCMPGATELGLDPHKVSSTQVCKYCGAAKERNKPCPRCGKM